MVRHFLFDPGSTIGSHGTFDGQGTVVSTAADKHEYRDLGYSSHDVISTMFKVTKIHPSLSEHAKLEFIKVLLGHFNGMLVSFPVLFLHQYLRLERSYHR